MLLEIAVLTKLIGGSLALSEAEKLMVIEYARKNPDKIKKLISIFSNEKERITTIKNRYKEKVQEIKEDYKTSLLGGIKNLQKKGIEQMKKKLLRIKKEESSIEENIDLLLKDL